MPAKDIRNQQFTRWLVIGYNGSSKHGTTWLCRCICGTERVVRGDHLIKGQSKSCGCLSAELAGQRIANITKRHGHSSRGKKSGTYRSWIAMRRRCSDPNNNRFSLYGGRGITVCDEWRTSFDAFLSDMGERPQGTTLDRVDPNTGYTKDNCRWASVDEQANNTRKSRKLTYNGITKTYTQWGRDLFNSAGIIHRRKSAGWSDHDALTIPPDCQNRVIKN